METTKNGNIKIEVNPDRKYQGQFVGWRYYNLNTLKSVFKNVSDFSELDPWNFDLGDGANNAEMIMHHVVPFRNCGYIVE